MSALEKFAVYDDRIIQAAPSYAVYKGGESVTATQFKAISANTSQHNFNVVVPSPNIYVDRAVDWVSDCMLVFNVNVANGVGQAGITTGNAGTIPVITLGKDCALSAFPLHSMTNTMSASINDVTVSMNTAELLPQLLRMVDYKANLKQRTCPSMLDTFASYNDAYGSFSNPLNSYFESVVQGNYAPNGAYNRIQFCNPNTGVALAGNGNYTYGGTQVWYNNGIPQCGSSNATVGGVWVINVNLAAMPIGILFRSCEKLVLPPFIFADSKELTTGLFGINAFQLTCNMISTAGLQRVIRSTTANFRTVSNIAFIGNGFANSQLNVEFITPSLSIPLPPVSSVPWMEMPRYTTPVSINAGQTAVIQSNNYVLSCIPDYFMIFAKPQAGTYAATDADYLLPISNIQLNFNNYAGLMTTMTVEQLYHMSVQNGLECDFNMFCGKGRVAPANTISNLVQQGANLVGCPLIIRPGKDFALSQGLACGVNGNFNLQFAVTLTNNSANDFNGNALLYLVAINSGFFESHAGSSRIIKAPLNEADVISASAVNPMGKQKLDRLVGGGFFDKISSILNKGAHIYGLTKPYVSAIKGALPEGKIKDVLGGIGYGKHAKDAVSKMESRILKAE